MSRILGKGLTQAAAFLVVFFGLVVGAFAQSPPNFSKIFTPNQVGVGGTSTLTFTIENIIGTPVTSIAFTDNLPAGMVLASPASPTTNCTGGTFTAVSGGSTLSYTGGALGGNQTCTLSVNVVGNTAGVLTNTTGDLTSSLGNSGTATDDLSVVSTNPVFSKSFSPSTVPVGGTSRLTFTIDNSANTDGISNLNFVDNLPSGMTIASTPNAAFSSSCNVVPFTGAPGGAPPTFNASAGSGLISFANAFGTGMAAGSLCTIGVDVTAGASGELVNISNNLSFAGPFGGVGQSAGIATASLIVPAATNLELSKVFTDDPVSPGGVANLQFTIRNPDAANAATNIAFTDDLDAMLPGATIIGSLPADPCGVGSSLSGTGLLTFAGGSLPARASCTFDVSVQVPLSASAGTFTNVTSDLSATFGGAPFVGASASADLVVSNVAPLQISKSFTNDPVVSGNTVDLEFTISNPNPTEVATAIGFSDSLDFVSGLTAGSLPTNPCGAGSILFTAGFPNQLQLAGGSLAASDSCTFTVQLNVPAGTVGGSFPSTSSSVSGTIAGNTLFGGPASDTLVVDADLSMSINKQFSVDNAVVGSPISITFTLNNSSEGVNATNISFTDDLNVFNTGAILSGAGTNDCGGTVGGVGTSNMSFNGGTLAGNTSCSITIPVTLGPAVAGSGTNTTSDITASANGATAAVVPGSAGTDTITVTTVLPLVFSKTYLDDPVIAGGSVNLEFSITNPNTGEDATGILFFDNLAGSLAGLAAVAPLPTNPCGASSAITGTTFLIFTGGSLAAGDTCTFNVTVAVPLSAADGSYVNTTGAQTATIGGVAVASSPATDTLVVQSEILVFSKEFTDDPVTAGNDATLVFNIENTSATQAVSNLAFTDDLNAMLAGATGTLSSNTCGGTFSDGATLSLASGSVAAGNSCQITVAVAAPGGTATGSFTNTTGTLTGEAAGLSVSGGTATDQLQVISAASPTFSKQFSGPTTATGTASLQFTINNPAGGNTLTSLAFSDDLDAVITGLASTSGNLTDVCGVGSSISGTSFLTFSGGTLAPGASCTFSVDVLVPVSATAGTFNNTTSNLLEAGLFQAPPATADLTIEPAPAFAKVFAPDTILLGQTSTLTFTVNNAASALGASSLAFNDTFPAGMVVAATPNTSNNCGGTFTATAGSGAVSLSAGSVASGSQCTLSVDVTPTAQGALLNTTGDLTSSSGNSGTAAATLTVNAPTPPAFAKVFAPASIAQGAVSTLTFTIDNSASPLDATALDFTDALPVAISVAANPNTSNTCTGGTLTANAGSSSISYTSGTVVGLATCEISVDVTSVTVGTHTNLTGDLTSSLGNSGTATDDLTVTAQAPPVFTKVFAPDSIVQGNVSTLTFTIDNSTSALDATALNFNDVLPTAIRIAASPNTSNTCTGGSLNATAGDGSISYSGGTVSAGATCEISVDVRSTSVGSHTNITDDLTSSLGNSGTATDILTVTAQAPPTFAKVFSPDTIRQGATSTLTFTIDNASSAIDATALAFADNMPAAILIATTPNVTNTCTGGTVIADSGTSLISYSGGTVGLGNSCTISVDVISTTVGTHINTTGDLISSLGNSGTATDQLTVTAQAPPTFTKVFTPDTIFQTDVSTLTFTIDNSTSLLAATSLNFTDNFPAAITVAGIPSVSNSCTGGTVTAAAGSSSISYTGGAVQPSTACEISVSVTSSTVGTHTNTSGALTSSLGDSGTATDDLTVNFQPNGNLTIVQNSDEDGTFGFSSSTAALNFSIVTAGGTGQQGRISLPAGTFVVQQVRPEGVGNTSISCDDGNSSGVSSMGVLTVQLAPLENVVCTFNSISTQQKTVDTINRFLTRRTDMILSNEPSSGRRIDRLKGSSNSTETVGFTPGDIPSLLPFDVETSGLQSGNVKVRTSLKQIKKSFATNSLVNSPEGETVTIDNSRFDLWFEGSYSRFDEGGSEGHFAIGYIGADYLLNPDLLVGAMVQFDDMEDVNRPDNSTISGTGWLLGPYLTARLSDNLYFDGRFAWGQSDNTVSPFNTYSDDFETERWLVSGSLTGEFEIEDFRLRPNITFSYIEEDQGAYTDSLNVAIPSQTVSLGQLRFGPNISTSFADENGTVFSPHFTIDGIYNFGDTEGVTVTNPETARSQGWRARAEAGVNISTTDGISLGVSGHYDGLGQSDVDLWGGSINLSIPLN